MIATKNSASHIFFIGKMASTVCADTKSCIILNIQAFSCRIIG